MTMWARLGLKLRFLVAVVVSATLFTVVAGALVRELALRRAEDAAAATVEALQAAVGKTAAIAVYVHDPALMQEMVQGVARSSLVAGARIVGVDGRVLAQAPAGAASAPRSPLRGDRPLVSPFDRSERLGSFEVDIDVPQVARAAAREAWTLVALVAALSAFLALVVYLVGTRLVSRPLQRLARKLSSLPAGTGEELPVPARHARDEIGTLLRAANELLRTNAQALERERALRRDIEKMEAQYRQIFDSTSAGIFVLDRDGRLINGNPTVLRMVCGGLADVSSLRGPDFLERVFARPERLREMIEASARDGKTVAADVELPAEDGRPRWAHCLVCVREPGGMVEGVLYDVTERKQAEHDVRRRAEHDALTGVLNRAATHGEIDRHLAHAPATMRLTLVYVDLDGFKQVNDRHGHGAGDSVLRDTARRLSEALRRSTDFVGRIGGDEFLVVLPQADCNDPGTIGLAGRIVESLRAPFVLEDGTLVNIGVSAGLASFPRHGRDRRALEQAADEAMYSVKRNGKNGYAVSAEPGARAAGQAAPVELPAPSS